MQKKSSPADGLGSEIDHENMLEVGNFAECAGTPLRRWEDALELPVSLFILPLFILANTGITFSFASFVDSMQHPAFSWTRHNNWTCYRKIHRYFRRLLAGFALQNWLFTQGC